MKSRLLGCPRQRPVSPTTHSLRFLSALEIDARIKKNEWRKESVWVLSLYIYHFLSNFIMNAVSLPGYPTQTSWKILSEVRNGGFLSVWWTRLLLNASLQLSSWKNRCEFLGSRSRSCINPGEKQQMRGISCSGEASASCICLTWLQHGPQAMRGLVTSPGSPPRGPVWRGRGVGETPSRCCFNLPYSRLCLQRDPSTSPQLVWPRYFIYDTSALFFSSAASVYPVNSVSPANTGWILAE